jgi:hypothetical protein
MLPSLKPEGDRPEALATTGTDARPMSQLGSALAARTMREGTDWDGSRRNGPDESGPGSSRSEPG